VAMLARIATATEPYRLPISPKELFRGIELRDNVPAAKLSDLAIDTILQYSSRAFVFVRTTSGNTARSIARLRPTAWVIAVSSRQVACRQTQFSSGVYAVNEPELPDDWVGYSRDWLRANCLEADVVVWAEGTGTGNPDARYRTEIADLRRMRESAIASSSS